MLGLFTKRHDEELPVLTERAARDALRLPCPHLTPLGADRPPVCLDDERKDSR